MLNTVLIPSLQQVEGEEDSREASSEDALTCDGEGMAPGVFPGGGRRRGGPRPPGYRKDTGCLTEHHGPGTQCGILKTGPGPCAAVPQQRAQGRQQVPSLGLL